MENKGTVMNGKKIVFEVISLAVLTSVMGCKQKKQEQVERVVPVEVYIAKPDSISSYVKLTGGIEAQNDAFVYSKVSEKLINVNVKSGDVVKAGQILAVQYNKSALQGKLVAEASLKSAQIQLKSRKDDFVRMTNLLAKNAITRQQFDQAKSQFDVAQATFEQASAAMEQADVQYENAILRAPFDGRVGMVYYEVNEMVPAGQQVIKIVNANTVKAKLRLPAVDIRKISIGQQVLAYFPSSPDTQFSGTVYRIDEAVDPLTRTLEVEIRLKNENNALKSGLFGEFMIEIAKKKNAVVVSELTVMTRTEIITNEKGIQTELPDYYVYLIKNGKAEKKSVRTGIVSGGFIEINKGISFGDSIIVTGQNIVKGGDTVRIVNGTER